MSTTNAPSPVEPFDAGEPIVVFDLASLRFQWGASNETVSVLTNRGELLSTVDAPDAPQADDGSSFHTVGDLQEKRVREAAFAALEHAAATARLSRGTALCRVAFYNPFTAEVSVGALPSTRVFCAPHQVEIPLTGADATLFDDAELGLMDCLGVTLVERASLTPALATRLLAAHTSV